MKQNHNTWYGMRGPDAVVQCHQCAAEFVLRRGGLSDEMLRKKLRRERWEVGKTRQAHRCPQCAGTTTNAGKLRDGSKSATIIALFPDAALEEAWANSTPQQRTRFWHKHHDELLYTLPSPDPYWQHGPHIDNMPKEANEPIAEDCQPTTLEEEKEKSPPSPPPRPASRAEIDSFLEAMTKQPHIDADASPSPEKDDEAEEWWKELQKRD